MAVNIRKLTLVVAAAVIIGSAFANTAFAARSHRYLGTAGWDPGGGDFRWTYGPSIAWYYEAHDDCVLRRRILVNRRGRHFVRWLRVCN